MRLERRAIELDAEKEFTGDGCWKTLFWKYDQSGGNMLKSRPQWFDPSVSQFL